MVDVMTVPYLSIMRGSTDGDAGRTKPADEVSSGSRVSTAREILHHHRD